VYDGRTPPFGGLIERANAPGHTIVTGGMPGWEIMLITAAAAILAAAVAVVLDRTRTARRQLTAPNA
jgi:hypothetical protein